MGWSLGYDSNWHRDIGYGVPAYCDYPGCNARIHRGLAYVCGGEPYGGDEGCGLYFCYKHLHACDPQLCSQCSEGKEAFDPKPDHPEWIKFKLKDKSWARWRKENKEEVKKIRKQVRSNG